MQRTARNFWIAMFTLALAAGGGRFAAAQTPGSPSAKAAKKTKQKDTGRLKTDAMFDRVDRDNDGMISKDEFRSAMAKWHKGKGPGKKERAAADRKGRKRAKHGQHGYGGGDHGRQRHAHGRFHRYAGFRHDGHRRGAATRGWGRSCSCCYCQRGYDGGAYRGRSGRRGFAHGRSGPACGPRGCAAAQESERGHRRGHHQAGDHRRGHRQASQRGQGPRGQGPQAAFVRFDKNNDGKLAKDEVPAPIWQHMQKADQDGNGTVSKEELKEARKKLRSKAPGRGRGPDEASAEPSRPADATDPGRPESDAGDATVQNESSPAATDSGSQ